MSRTPALHQQLREQGFLHLRGIWSPTELEEIRHLLDEGRTRRPDLPRDAWGTELVPLLDTVPELQPHLDAPALFGALTEALGGPVARLHSAARFTSLSGGGFLPWHFHAPGEGTRGDGRWNPDRPGGPTAPGPLIVCAYPDGADAENGPLWMYPRTVDAPWAPPSTDRTARWPGTVELHLAPGDAVAFTLGVYHAAWCHRGPRRIFGGVWARTEAERP